LILLKIALFVGAVLANLRAADTVTVNLVSIMSVKCFVLEAAGVIMALVRYG
jgi:hypothetical protein